MLSLFSSLSLPLFSVCELACSGSCSGRKLVSLAQISAEVVLWGVALSLSYRSNHQFAELPSAQINFFLSSGVALLNYLGTTSISISFSVGILPLSFLGQWVIEEGRFCFRKLCCLEEQRNASLGRNRAFMSVACSIVLSVLKWWSSYWTLCPGHCVNREGSITLPFNTVSFCRIFSHSSVWYTHLPVMSRVSCTKSQKARVFQHWLPCCWVCIHSFWKLCSQCLHTFQ